MTTINLLFVAEIGPDPSCGYCKRWKSMSFSAMNHAKTKLWNRMGDQYLNDCLVSAIFFDVLVMMMSSNAFKQWQIAVWSFYIRYYVTSVVKEICNFFYLYHTNLKLIHSLFSGWIILLEFWWIASLNFVPPWLKAWIRYWQCTTENKTTTKKSARSSCTRWC